MNADQKKLARYALGLPNDNNRSYRNRFSAARGSDVCDLWEAMRDNGEADVFAYGETLKHFNLTEDGARRALDDGETLDPEDFR